MMTAQRKGRPWVDTGGGTANCGEQSALPSFYHLTECLSSEPNTVPARLRAARQAYNWANIRGDLEAAEQHLQEYHRLEQVRKTQLLTMAATIKTKKEAV